MKLRIIMEVMKADPGKQGVLERAFRSVGDFERKVVLLPMYIEINNVFKMYEAEREKIYNEIVDSYCTEVNAKGEKEKGEGFVPLKRKEVTSIPLSYFKEFEAKTDALLEKNAPLKEKMRFTAEEIRDSGLDGHDMMVLKDFYDIKELAGLGSLKNKEDKK